MVCVGNAVYVCVSVCVWCVNVCGEYRVCVCQYVCGV